jgi:hypothetical protein
MIVGKILETNQGSQEKAIEIIVVKILRTNLWNHKQTKITIMKILQVLKI